MDCIKLIANTYRKPASILVGLLIASIVSFPISILSGSITGFWVGFFVFMSSVPAVTIFRHLLRVLGIGQVRLMFKQRFLSNLSLGLLTFSVPMLIIYLFIKDPFCLWLLLVTIPIFAIFLTGLQRVYESPNMFDEI